MFRLFSSKPKPEDAAHSDGPAAPAQVPQLPDHPEHVEADPRRPAGDHLNIDRHERRNQSPNGLAKALSAAMRENVAIPTRPQRHSLPAAVAASQSSKARSIGTPTDATRIESPVTVLTSPGASTPRSRSPDERRHLSRSRDHIPIPGSIIRPSSSQPSDTSVHSDRLLAWRKFTRRQDQILSRRIRADEARRGAGFAREAVMENIELVLTTVRATGTTEAADLSQHIQALAKGIAELRENEREVAEKDNELVQAESALRRVLPQILGSDNDETFEALKGHDLHIQPWESTSTTSDRDAALDEQELSTEQLQYYRKLIKVDDLEGQLLELGNIQEKLKAQEEAELDARSLAFLQEYDSEIERLSKELGTARFQLQLVKDILQQPLPVSDDESEVFEHSAAGSNMVLSRSI